MGGEFCLNMGGKNVSLEVGKWNNEWSLEEWQVLSILELCNKYYINSQARYLGDSMRKLWFTMILQF